LKLAGSSFHSRTSLFEAKRLYNEYKRYTRVINGNLHLDNISIPPALSKKHLMLIANASSDCSQQDLFIEKVVRNSLTSDNLKKELEASIPKQNNNYLLIINNLILRKKYDLRSLKIKNKMGENQIRNHIINNISCFIKIVLNNGFSFLPNQNIFIGGATGFLDLVFYDVIHHRYLIIDLKSGGKNISEINRGRSQMVSYVQAYDNVIDNSFQKKTIGLILGKEPIDIMY